MLNKTIKFSLVAALTAGSLSLTACTDEDFALGAGLIIGVAVGSAIDNDHHDHDHRGGGRYDGGRGHGRGPGRYHYSATVSDDILLSDSAITAKTTAVAEHYQLPAESASVVLEALETAKAGDLSKVSELGVTREEIITMARGENPSANTLLKLSETLGLSLSEAHNLVQQMKADLVAAQTK